MPVLLLEPLGAARLSEALGEGVVVYLQAGDLLVLVGSDGDELRLLEGEGAELFERQPGNVVCPHYVEAGLILVHRIEDRLRK